MNVERVNSVSMKNPVAASSGSGANARKRKSEKKVGVKCAKKRHVQTPKKISIMKKLSWEDMGNWYRALNNTPYRVNDVRLLFESVRTMVLECTVYEKVRDPRHNKDVVSYKEKPLSDDDQVHEAYRHKGNVSFSFGWQETAYDVNMEPANEIVQNLRTKEMKLEQMSKTLSNQLIKYEKLVQEYAVSCGEALTQVDQIDRKSKPSSWDSDQESETETEVMCTLSEAPEPIKVFSTNSEDESENETVEEEVEEVEAED